MRGIVKNYLLPAILGFSVSYAVLGFILPKPKPASPSPMQPTQFAWTIGIDTNKPIPGPFDTLRVGPYTYKVTWYSGTFHCGVELADGCTSYDDLKIQIMKGTPGYTRSVVLHEVMHAVAALYQNPYDGKELSGEEWAQTSPEFLEVLRDNPKLVKYLTEGE